MTGLWWVFWLNAGAVGTVVGCAVLRLLVALTHPFARCGKAWRALCAAVDRAVLALAAEPVGPSRALDELPLLEVGQGRHRLGGLRPPLSGGR